jgi:tetratricopeptide (TPR) repeat protein
VAPAEVAREGEGMLSYLRTWFRWNGRRYSGLVASWWWALTKFVLNSIGAATLVFLAALVYKAVFQRSITIEPISVPRLLARAGYSPDVAAKHLRDALVMSIEQAKQSLSSPVNDSLISSSGYPTPPIVMLHGDIPEIVLPTVGLSLEAVASQIRTFLRLHSRRNISGEITMHDNAVYLRLRKNGEIFYNDNEGVDAKDPDALFRKAVLRILDVAEPYISAYVMSRTRPLDSLKIARRVVDDRNSTEQHKAARILIGSVLQRKRKFDQAIIEYKRIIDLDNTFADAHDHLGLALLEKQQFEEAVAEFNKAIAIAPRLGSLHNHLAGAKIAQGAIKDASCEDTRAVEELRRAVDDNSEDPIAHNELGVALFKQQRALGMCDRAAVQTGGGVEDAAISEFSDAVMLSQNYWLAHFNLGYTLVYKNSKRDIDQVTRERNTQKAIDEFKLAINGDPSLTNAAFELLKLYKERNDDESVRKTLIEIIASYSKRVEDDDDDATFYFGRGIVWYEQRKIDEAIEDWGKAIQLDPSYADAYNNRCFVIASTNNDAQHLHQALDDCNKGLALDIADPWILDSRGLVYLKLGEFAKAVDDYDEALKRDPKNPDSLYGRGVAKKRKGDIVGGNADIKLAIDQQKNIAEKFAKYGVTDAAIPKGLP